MRRIVTVAALGATTLAVGLMPSPASAHKRHHHAGEGKARQACKAEREQIGAEAFKEKYANENGKRALKRCVRTRLKAARATCRSERESLGKEGFRERYANQNGKHARKRCIREHADD